MGIVAQEWGIICPKCESDDHIHVEIKTWARLTDSTDTEEGCDRSHSWNSDSRCHCAGCDWWGRVHEAEMAFEQAAEGESA